MVRFLSKCRWESFVDPDTNTTKRHLVWQGATSSGGASYDRRYNKKRGPGRKKYGSFRVKGKTVRAHKFAAVAILGLRPGPGDEIDHRCYHTLCVSCLENVPRAVNQARIRRGGNSANTRELSAGIFEDGQGRDAHPMCRCTTITITACDGTLEG